MAQNLLTVRTIFENETKYVGTADKILVIRNGSKLLRVKIVITIECDCNVGLSHAIQGFALIAFTLHRSSPVSGFGLWVTHLTAILLTIAVEFPLGQIYKLPASPRSRFMVNDYPCVLVLSPLCGGIFILLKVRNT